MRKILSLAFFIGLVVVNQSFGATYYTYVNGGSSGFWNAPGTWTTDPSGLSLTGSAVPVNNDVVYILNGFTVLLNANVTTTGLSVVINGGGALDLAGHTMAPISTLSGSGTLRIGSAYFPSITTNNFPANAGAGATVVYYDFTGLIPPSLNYPNLLLLNTTATNHTITFSNASAYSGTISGNLMTVATGTGSLSAIVGSRAGNNISLTVNGNITIGANTLWGVGQFNSAHAITAMGDMTNNGAVDFSNTPQYANPTSGYATLSFNGTTNNTLACNGITDLFSLTVDKGTSSTYMLSVTSSAVANFNLFGRNQLIFIENGTLRLGANINIPRIHGSASPNYDLGFTNRSPMFWIDGADVNFNGSALVVYGKFRITAGAFTSLGGEGTVIREEGQYLIEGGTFTTEKFRPSNTASTHRGSFIMSGGTFNAVGTGSNGDYARFSQPYPEQVFIMSGGIINVRNPQSGGNAAGGGIHIGCKSSNFVVTGGTFNAYLGGAATFFNISSTAPFWNLNILRTGGPTTARLAGIGNVSNTITTAQPLVVLNDFTLDGVNFPVFSSNGLDVSIGRNFLINVGATYSPGSNTTTFNGVSNQTFTDNGTISGNLHNLKISKASGNLVLAGSAVSFTVTNQLSLLEGVLNDGGKNLIVLGNIINEATHTGPGAIHLNGGSTQIISGNGNGVFGNVVLNNTSTPGVRATSDLTIGGILTLAGTSNSLFDINENRLSLSSASASAVTTTGNTFSNVKMIRTLGFQSDRGVRKTYGNLGAFTYPIGAGNSYTPATLQLTSAPAAYGSITVRPVNSRHPLVEGGNTNNLTWYWKVTAESFVGVAPGSITHTYRYLDANALPSGDDANYIPARYNPTSWTVINDLTRVNEVANTITFAAVDYIEGEYTAGMAAAFGIVQIFYSKRNGNWTNTSPGATPWSNVSHTGADASTYPTAGDQVYIGDGVSNNHVIVVTSNGQSAGGLDISSGSTLDVGISTGHNFGAFDNRSIAGSGSLRISSAATTAQFPAGDFGHFIRSTGGTVEYYSTGSQNFTIPSVSAAPTNLPLTSYRHLILSPGTGQHILLPNIDQRIYGSVTVTGVSASGVARLNSAAARELTIDGNVIVSSGTLQFSNGNAQAVEVKGNISVAGGAVFEVASIGVATSHQLTIYGNLLNNGTFDMAAASDRVVNTTFTGAVNTSISGSGSVTDFNVLTVNKGISQTSILNVNASAFSLSGGAAPLILNAGTFRLSSPQSVTIASGTSFNVPATARLSANGGTLRISGASGIDLLLAGSLEVLNGAIDVGTMTNDNSIEYAATGTPTISVAGGTLNVHGQVRRSFASSQGGLIYSQSGGVVLVGVSSASMTTRGVFEILNNGSSFVMTGGTLRIIRPLTSGSLPDLYLHPSMGNVTGGTIEIGGNSVSTIGISTIIPLFNVTVTGTSTTAQLIGNPLVLRGSLTVLTDNIFNAASFNVSIAGNLVNANPGSASGINTGGFRPGSMTQTTTLNGTVSHQTVSGAAGNVTNFANLVINNSFTGGTVTLQGNSALRVNNTLSLNSGTLADGGNNITVIGTVVNSATHTSTGSGRITLNGSAAQLVSGNGNGRFGNLTLNNPSGAVFGANQEVSETLTLTNGSLFIGQYGLHLSSTSLAAVSGTTSSRYIITAGNISDEGVTKAFAPSVTNGNFVFPVGVSGKFTPADYTITTGATGGTVRIRPVNSRHPGATGSGTAIINYYWSVERNGLSVGSLTHRYTYAAVDQAGNPDDYRDARFQGGAWNIGTSPGNPNIVTRVITFTNTDITGDYTAGEATAFVNPTTYTSIASGNWQSDLAVWDIDPPGTNLGPPPGSFVIISEGHTVSVTANTRRTATLQIRGRLHLGGTTGHDFGVVSTGGSGQRTLQLQSATFPSGNFSSFNAANGGTVEYDGPVVLPTQAVYNNLSFTGAGLKTLPNTDLTINGNITVHAGSVTNAVSNRNITLVSTSGDFTNMATFVTGSGHVWVGRNFVNSGTSANFSSGNGSQGFIVNGDLSNVGGTFLSGSDNIRVSGSVSNSGVFNLASGDLQISGSLLNTAGTFSANTGMVAVNGSVTNNASFNAGAGQFTIDGSFLNSGASAVFSANGNTMNLSGNFTNEASAVFNGGTGAIILGGNWGNTGVYNAQNSRVTFARNATQTLTGATTFFDIVRSNGGNLVMNSDATITGSLTLTSGNIVTGTNLIALTNTTADPIMGSGVGSFIDGRLAIRFPTTAGASRIFPVGKGTVYRPVSIQQTATSALPLVSVEMYNTPPSGIFPTDVGRLSEARYYSIDLLSGTMNAPTISISFNTNAPVDEDVVQPANAHVMKSADPTGPWTDEGGSGVFAPAAPAGYVVSGVTSIDNPSFFTLGYRDALLPVTLLGFNGILRNGVVELTWKTASEMRNNYFTIERSTAEMQFDSLTSVPGAGDSKVVRSYITIDEKPLPGKSYYRLKQTDFDGRFTYSDLIAINNDGSGFPYLSVYPNPSSSEWPLLIQLEFAKLLTSFVSITDATGKIHFQGHVDISDEKDLLDVTGIRQLPSGVYFLRVINGSYAETRKLVRR